MKVLTNSVNPAYVHEVSIDQVERIEGDIVISVRDRRLIPREQPTVVFSLAEAAALRDRLNELLG